jgi:hypothetical protein
MNCNSFLGSVSVEAHWIWLEPMIATNGGSGCGANNFHVNESWMFAAESPAAQTAPSKKSRVDSLIGCKNINILLQRVLDGKSWIAMEQQV